MVESGTVVWGGDGGKGELGCVGGEQRGEGNLSVMVMKGLK